MSRPRSPYRWKAGVAKLDITPREPIWLAGWGGRDQPMRGVSQKIWTKVLALQDQTGHRGVWVTADLLGYSKAMTEAVVRRCARNFGLKRDQLIINASHNHSGPVTGDLLHLYFDLTRHQYDVIDRYTRWLLDRIVDAIARALADLAPARISFGQGLAGLAVNRRRSRPGGRCLPAVVDQDVPVLAVNSPAGDLRAVVFGYACHTTCVNDGCVNGDYAGWAQQKLEESFPGSIALFVAGCGGDANPLPRHQPGLGEAYGFVLASAVSQVVRHDPGATTPGGISTSGEMFPLHGPLRTVFGETVLPFEPLPTRQDLLSALPGRTGARRREIEFQLHLIEGRDRRPTEVRYPVHVWNFGDGLRHIALSSEPVADYAIRFKGAYGCESTWVSGYNDEFLTYIPSLRVWREGGYEGHTGMLECDMPGAYSPRRRS